MKVAKIIFEREKLLLFKLKAKRTRVWFKALTNIDRALVDLVIKVVDKVQSPKLGKSLLTILRKLEEALENRTYRIIRTVGLPLARKLASLAKNGETLRLKNGYLTYRLQDSLR